MQCQVWLAGIHIDYFHLFIMIIYIKEGHMVEVNLGVVYERYP